MTVKVTSKSNPNIWYAYKKAVNTGHEPGMTHEQLLDKVTKENKFKILCRGTRNGVNHIDLEFIDEQALIMFMLRWS